MLKSQNVKCKHDYLSNRLLECYLFLQCKDAEKSKVLDAWARAQNKQAEVAEVKEMEGEPQTTKRGQKRDQDNGE